MTIQRTAIPAVEAMTGVDLSVTAIQSGVSRGVPRNPDWPERLAEFLDGNIDLPFAWGKNDCALFSCAAVEAMTGVDLAAPLRGTYSNVGGSVKVLRKFAGAGLEAAAVKIADDAGLEAISPKLAGRGDLVLFDSDAGVALGVVSSDGMTVRTVGLHGLVSVYVLGCRRAWRVA